jgi:hypothetical protein
MTQGLRFVLLIFALVGFAGAGASLAVARYRKLADGERDLGMMGVAVMLFIFGALCTLIGAGFAGVFAFGGVVVWASYLFMAQRLGIFRIEAGGPPSAEEEATEEPKRAE